MDTYLKNVVLSTIIRQKKALRAVDGHSLSKTDLEVLACSSNGQLISVYQLRTIFPYTNIQQLRRSVKKLIDGQLLELMSSGYKNKPAYYVISRKGERAVAEVINKILSFE